MAVQVLMLLWTAVELVHRCRMRGACKCSPVRTAPLTEKGCPRAEEDTLECGCGHLALSPYGNSCSVACLLVLTLLLQARGQQDKQDSSAV